MCRTRRCPESSLLTRVGQVPLPADGAVSGAEHEHGGGHPPPRNLQSWSAGGAGGGARRAPGREGRRGHAESRKRGLPSVPHLSPWPSSPPSPRGHEPLRRAGAALRAGTPTPALPSGVEEPTNTSASAPWEAAALERDRQGPGGGCCLSTAEARGGGSSIRGAGGGRRALALQNTSLVLKRCHLSTPGNWRGRSEIRAWESKPLRPLCGSPPHATPSRCLWKPAKSPEGSCMQPSGPPREGRCVPSGPCIGILWMLGDTLHSCQPGAWLATLPLILSFLF